jgi:hypothetical protein
MATTTAKPKPKPANGRTPKRAAAVAVAELSGGSGGSTTETFRGVELSIPAQLPQTFMMDFAEMQEMQISGSPNAIGMAAMLVKSVIGDEQWRRVRNSMIGEMSKDGGAEVLGDLVGMILNGTNVEAGESPASGTP